MRIICPPAISEGNSRCLFTFLSNYHKQLSLDNNVLDLGCGRWRHVKLLKVLGFHSITAIDKTKFPGRPHGINFIQHDLEQGIPIDSATQNIIIATFLFMFILNRQQLANEITRVARPGAFLIFELTTKRPVKNGYPFCVKGLRDLFLANGWRLLHFRLDAGFIMKRGGARGER